MSTQDRAIRGEGAAEHDGGEHEGEAAGGVGGGLEPGRLRAMQRRWIQRKAGGAGGGGGGAAAAIPGGPGAALGGGVQSKMERTLGADLSGVRVHTGGDSAEAADALGARAFTVGGDVHFGRGEFAPGSKEGDRLLAHELTHVVQGQKSGVQRKPAGGGGEHGDHEAGGHEVSEPGDAAEHEADAMGDHAADKLHGGGGEHGAAGGEHAAAGGEHTAGGKKQEKPGVSAPAPSVGRKIFRAGKPGAQKKPPTAAAPPATAKAGAAAPAGSAQKPKSSEETNAEQVIDLAMGAMSKIDVGDPKLAKMVASNAIDLARMLKQFPGNDIVKAFQTYLETKKQAVLDKCNEEMGGLGKKLDELKADNPQEAGKLQALQTSPLADKWANNVLCKDHPKITAFKDGLKSKLKTNEAAIEKEKEQKKEAEAKAHAGDHAAPPGGGHEKKTPAAGAAAPPTPAPVPQGPATGAPPAAAGAASPQATPKLDAKHDKPADAKAAAPAAQKAPPPPVVEKKVPPPVEHKADAPVEHKADAPVEHKADASEHKADAGAAHKADGSPAAPAGEKAHDKGDAKHAPNPADALKHEELEKKKEVAKARIDLLLASSSRSWKGIGALLDTIGLALSLEPVRALFAAHGVEIPEGLGGMLKDGAGSYLKAKDKMAEIMACVAKVSVDSIESLDEIDALFADANLEQHIDRMHFHIKHLTKEEALQKVAIEAFEKKFGKVDDKKGGGKAKGAPHEEEKEAEKEEEEKKEEKKDAAQAKPDAAAKPGDKPKKPGILKRVGHEVKAEADTLVNMKEGEERFEEADPLAKQCLGQFDEAIEPVKAALSLYEAGKAQFVELREAKEKLKEAEAELAKVLKESGGKELPPDVKK